MKRTSHLVARTALAIALTFTLVPAISGCIVGKVMTPQEIEQYGTKLFPAPKAKVFKAAIAALKSQGYTIAIEDEEKGIIKTAPKVMGQVVSKYSTASNYRKYFLSITEEGGQTKVVATPKVGTGERDRSDDPAWVLEGPAGERVLWTKLFQEITELM